MEATISSSDVTRRDRSFPSRASLTPFSGSRRVCIVLKQNQPVGIPCIFLPMPYCTVSTVCLAYAKSSLIAPTRSNFGSGSGGMCRPHPRSQVQSCHLVSPRGRYLHARSIKRPPKKNGTSRVGRHRYDFVAARESFGNLLVR